MLERAHITRDGPDTLFRAYISSRDIVFGRADITRDGPDILYPVIYLAETLCLEDIRYPVTGQIFGFGKLSF